MIVEQLDVPLVALERTAFVEDSRPAAILSLCAVHRDQGGLSVPEAAAKAVTIDAATIGVPRPEVSPKARWRVRTLSRNRSPVF